MILLDLPLSIALVEISTQALGMWPMMLAWGLVGWSLWRGEAGADTSDEPVLHRRLSRGAARA